MDDETRRHVTGAAARPTAPSGRHTTASRGGDDDDDDDEDERRDGAGDETGRDATRDDQRYANDDDG